LVLCPVALGGGRPLFPDHVESLGMKLSDAKTLDRGGVLLIYTPAS
jgi:hypothetical protein